MCAFDPADSVHYSCLMIYDFFTKISLTSQSLPCGTQGLGSRSSMSSTYYKYRAILAQEG